MDLKITLNNGTSDTVLDDYIVEGGVGALRIRVESDQPGQPGVVVLDTLSLEFPESALGTDFDSSTLATKKQAGTKYTVTMNANFGSGDRQAFIGYVDFDSVKHTSVGTVKFDVIDRLAWLRFVEKFTVRNSGSVSASGYYYFVLRNSATHNIVTIFKKDTSTGDAVDIPTGECLPTGGTWDDGGSYYFITLSERVDATSDGETVKANKLTLTEDWIASTGLAYEELDQVDYYDETIGGSDVNVYSGSSVTAFNAEDIATSILASTLGIAITNNTTANYYAHLDHFRNTGVGDYEEKIFGAHPYEALKKIIRNMRAYLYISSSTGNIVIDTRPTTAGTPDLTYTNDADGVLDYEKSHSWQQRVDVVTLRTDTHTDENEASYPDTYNETIHRGLEMTVYLPQNETLSQIAEDVWEFYGKRHVALSLKVELTDTVMQALDVLAQVRFDSIDYFIVDYEIDFDAETVDMNLVSYTTWEY